MRKHSLFESLLAATAGMTFLSPAVAADDSTTISGKVFADLTHYSASNDGVESSSNGTGLDVKRFYLGVAHTFDDTWSMNLTTDFNYVGNDGETQLFVKKAWVQARISDAFAARLGASDMPWMPYVEDLYGFRFVENTLIDRLKFGTSTDWGVHGFGKVADGKFSYASSVVTGGGFKNPTRTNSMDLEVRLGFMHIDGLSIGIGGYTGKLGKDIQGSATPPQHTANRLDAVVAYVQKSFRVGAEYFTADDWNNVTTVTSDKADGFSIWGSYDFNEKWGAFARGDSANTSKDLSPGLKDEYFNAGVVAHARKNIDIALVYKHERVDGGGFVNTSNGNFGGVAAGGKYDEVGVWTQFGF